MKNIISIIIVFLMMVIAIYALCSLIMWDTNIGSWPWYVRGIFVVWSLIALGRTIDSK